MSAALTAGELLRWGDLEARRRRGARGVLGAVTPMVIATAISGLLVLELLRRLGAFGASAAGDSDPTSVVGFSLAAIATAHILVVFGTPYRMYWRADSALLGRLPVPGGVLFRLALMRTLRATLAALLPVVAAVVVIGLQVHWTPALRLGAIGVACAAFSGLLAPAACLAAGGIVASDSAQAMLDSFGGEFRAPSVAWLGALPAFVATGIGLLTIGSAGWIADGSPWLGTELFASAGAVAFSIIAVFVALGAADRVLLAAQREIAALDQERLAHIDLSQAGPIERAWGSVVCRSDATGRVYAKDAALMRRRFPAPYFVAVLGIGAAWISVASDSASTAIVVICSLVAYSMVMARRLAIAPVELPRLLRTLPLAKDEAASAKRAAVILRALVWIGLASASLIVLGDDRIAAVIVVVVALAVSVIAGSLLAMERAR